MNTWHKASDPPPINPELKSVSDRIIIRLNDGYCIVGRYYNGLDGNFYEDQYKDLLRGVVAWMYLSKYDLDEAEP